MPVKKADALEPIQLTRLTDGELTVRIIGMSPVIPHKWSEKAKRMMPGHPEKDIVTKKGPRDAEGEAEACVYRLPDGRPGLPATAFKAAMVGGCRLFPAVTMAEAKVLFWVEGEGAEQLVPIEGVPVLREDTPRNSNGGSDLRYRFMFTNWSAVLRIGYIQGRITPDAVLSLLDAGGRGGVGDWRPAAPKSHSGTYGRFRVAVEEEAGA